MPVIASLNATSPSGWGRYARLLVTPAPTPSSSTCTGRRRSHRAEQVESDDLALVADVKAAVDIPVALKLSPFYSSMANFAVQAVHAGADGLVLFNRFYQPDLDVDTLEITPRLELSSPWSCACRCVDRHPPSDPAGLQPASPPPAASRPALTSPRRSSSAPTSRRRRRGSAPRTRSPARHRRGPRRVDDDHDYESVTQLRGSVSMCHGQQPIRLRAGELRPTLHSWTSPVTAGRPGRRSSPGQHRTRRIGAIREDDPRSRIWTAPPSDDRRWKIVGAHAPARIPARCTGRSAAQRPGSFGFLDPRCPRVRGRRCGAAEPRVRVATFYSYFTLKPPGVHTCVVCMGTACYINGATKLLGGIVEELGISAGQTTSDGQISVLTAHCVGACSVAPVVVIDGEVHGKLSAESVVQACATCDRPPGSSRAPGAPRTSLAAARRDPEGARARQRQRVRGGGRLSLGGRHRRHADGSRRPTGSPTSRCAVGCLGLCARGPLVDIPEHGRLFEGVTSSASVDAPADVATEPAARDAAPFFTRQVKVVLENSGRIDPENLDDYLATTAIRR